jgi:Flp pilus assembly protein TadG
VPSDAIGRAIAGPLESPDGRLAPSSTLMDHAVHLLPQGRRPQRSTVAAVRARRRQRGVTMVEFALMAPLAVVLLVGTVIGGIFSMNYVQLTNAVRDGVRAAAVCGGSGRNNQSQIPSSQIPTLPDGTACNDTNLKAFIRNRFQAIPGNQATLNVTLPTGGAGDHMSQCQYRKTIEIKATYDQPLYMPLVSRFLSNNGSGSTYTITAQAEATCEQ